MPAVTYIGKNRFLPNEVRTRIWHTETRHTPWLIFIYCQLAVFGLPMWFPSVIEATWRAWQKKEQEEAMKEDTASMLALQSNCFLSLHVGRGNVAEMQIEQLHLSHCRLFGGQSFVKTVQKSCVIFYCYSLLLACIFLINKDKRYPLLAKFQVKFVK